MFGKTRIKMVKEEVIDLYKIRLKEPTLYERSREDLIDYQCLEFHFTDGYRAGICFKGNVSKQQTVNKLRELATHIEEKR